MSDSLADPLTFSSREHSTAAGPRRLHNKAVVFSQMGEIGRLIDVFNLSAGILLPKALEIERIMRLKVPHGALKKVDLLLLFSVPKNFDPILGRSLSICYCNRFSMPYASYLNFN
jgi:hypothetical protein